MTRIAVWHNLTRKGYEATVIGRGRPVRQDATEHEREKSRREFFFGTTKEDALADAFNKLGLTSDEVEVVKASDTNIIYKGKREHTYTRHGETPAPTPETEGEPEAATEALAAA